MQRTQLLPATLREGQGVKLLAKAPITSIGTRAEKNLNTMKFLPLQKAVFISPLQNTGIRCAPELPALHPDLMLLRDRV